MKGILLIPNPTEFRDKLFKKLKGLYRSGRGGAGIEEARTRLVEGEGVLEAIVARREIRVKLVRGFCF